MGNFDISPAQPIPSLVAKGSWNQWLFEHEPEKTELHYRVSTNPEYRPLRAKFTGYRGGVDPWIIVHTQGSRLMFFVGLNAAGAAKFVATPPITDAECMDPKSHKGAFLIGAKASSDRIPTVKIARGSDPRLMHIIERIEIFKPAPLVHFYLSRAVKLGSIANVAEDAGGNYVLQFQTRMDVASPQSVVAARRPAAPPRSNKRVKLAPAAQSPDAARPASPAPPPPAAALAAAGASASRSRSVPRESRGAFQSPRANTTVDTSALAGYVYVLRIRADDQIFYYAGATGKTGMLPPVRITDHIEGRGCTKLLPATVPPNSCGQPTVVSIESVAARPGIPKEQELGMAEEMKTVQLFNEYGERNVRGGVWAQTPFGERLPDEESKQLRAIQSRHYRTNQPFGWTH